MVVSLLEYCLRSILGRRGKGRRRRCHAGPDSQRHREWVQAVSDGRTGREARWATWAMASRPMVRVWMRGGVVLRGLGFG